MAALVALGQQEQDLTDAQRKSILSQFEEWSQRLKIEGGKHQIWLTEVEAFDSKKDSDLQRFRKPRLDKEGGSGQPVRHLLLLPRLRSQRQERHVLGIKVSQGVRHPASTADQLSAPIDLGRHGTARVGSLAPH